MRTTTPPVSLLLLALAACSNSGSSSGAPALDKASAPRDEAVAADTSTAVDANNAFAIDLYGQASTAAKGGNFLTSPISANLALTMTYAGAQGDTQSQMAKVLHVPSGSTSIFDAQNALTQALDGYAAAAYSHAKEQVGTGATPPSQSDYELEVVNSVWGENGYPWASPFLDILARSYGAGVYQEDFENDPSGSETAINDWVSTETSGKIDPLLSPGTLDASTRLVLVNAIHVKLPWASPFDHTQTAPGTFTRGDGTTVNPSFMSQSFTGDNAYPAGYAETATGQFVSIPLASGALSVVFALPKKDLATLTGSLTKDSFNVSSASGESYEINLKLPKFSLTTPTFDLTGPLQALGMTDAFDPSKADFLGMCSEATACQGLYIGFVVQKAMMDVAENGVEAAAATAVGVSLGAILNPTIVNLTFDHPFVVSIVDQAGTILFLGQIDDPTASGT